MIVDTKFKANSHKFQVSFILLLVDILLGTIYILCKHKFQYIRPWTEVTENSIQTFKKHIKIHSLGTNAAILEVWSCILHNWNPQLTPVEQKCIQVTKHSCFWTNSFFFLLFYQSFHIIWKYRSHHDVLVKMYFALFTLKHLITIKSVSKTKVAKASNVTNASRKLSSKYVSTCF